MRILGFVPIHYGVEYLEASLTALSHVCDQVLVSYTSQPSHGHQAKDMRGNVLPCPETRDEIFDISKTTLKNKLIWEEAKSFPYEAAHRNTVWPHTDNNTIVVACDADEVFDSLQLESNLRKVIDSNKVRRLGIDGYVNFWKSFNHICNDSFRPIRIYDTRFSDGQSEVKTTIYHFGTCQSDRIMNYKYLCHGHKAEIRPNWLQEVYQKWTPDNQIKNLHPVAHNLWNAETYDKSKLPDILKSHPNYNKSVVF